MQIGVCVYIYIIFLARIKRLKRKYIHNIKTFPAHLIGNLFLELEEIVSSRLIYFFILFILYILFR